MADGVQFRQSAAEKGAMLGRSALGGGHEVNPDQGMRTCHSFVDGQYKQLKLLECDEDDVVWELSPMTHDKDVVGLANSFLNNRYRADM